jgi:WD40 repeat protein
MLATGGMEKKLRIFDLSLSSSSSPLAPNSGATTGSVTGSLISGVASISVPPRVGTPNGSMPSPAPPALVTLMGGGNGRATPTAAMATAGGSGRATPTPAPPSASGNGNGGASEGTSAPFYELGAGAHGGAIRSIVWTPSDTNVLATACEDRALRWWDLRARRAVAEVVLDGTVGTCELDRGGGDAGGGGAILSVAAGNAVYFFDAERPGALVKKVVTPYQIASVACNAAARRFITGSPGDTWVRVWDLDEEKEVGEFGRARGEGIRRLMRSQKLGRGTMGRFGRASSRRMGSCTRRGVKMERSSCGSSRADRTACGDES